MALALIAAVPVAAMARLAADHLAGRSSLDLQAHRGGLGLRPESSMAAFTNAQQLGVTTLELEVRITEDGRAVVTHDRQTNPVVCRDTGPTAGFVLTCSSKARRSHETGVPARARPVCRSRCRRRPVLIAVWAADGVRRSYPAPPRDDRLFDVHHKNQSLTYLPSLVFRPWL